MCICIFLINFYLHIITVPTEKPAFASTAFRRNRSDTSASTKALLMSAVLTTESWAAEVWSWPWPTHARAHSCINDTYDNDTVQLLYFLCWQEHGVSLVCLSNKAVPGNPAEEGRSLSFAFLSGELSVRFPGRSS